MTYRTLFILALTFMGASTLSAQGEFPPSGCMIKYEYDATGNRIQRYWYCWTEDGPDFKALQPDSAAQAARHLENVTMRVYPNPASDLLSISFAEPVGIGTLEVHDAQG